MQSNQNPFLILENGHYGNYGGSFVPEILMQPVIELNDAISHLIDKDFEAELMTHLMQYAGRPTPLTPATRLQEHIQGPRIYLKREDLLHTGAHKLNNALGQCLLAKKMGKHRIIAETGAGQHGVATATACAYLGIECVIYMGSQDVERQALNVARMQLLGAQVVPVNQGSCTLKDAINEALRDWSANYEQTFYCLGSALGPHPYPSLVAHFQAIIGIEAKQQCLNMAKQLPNYVIACLGGGSNAMGIFSAFLSDQVKLIAVEAGGQNNQLGNHAARFQGGIPGVLHGCYTYLLQDTGGQIANTHSISAGLDYPAVGPQHAHLYEINRVQYASANDQEALAAFKLLAKTEGILPALESSHALAYLMNHVNLFDKDDVVIVNLSGRGDKDLNIVTKDEN